MKRIFVTLTSTNGKKVWVNVDHINYIRTDENTAHFGASVIVTTADKIYVKEDYDTIKKMMLENVE